MTLPKYLIWLIPAAIVAFLALILILRLPVPKRRSIPAYWPTGDWQSSTPEEQGIDSAKLAEGVLAIRQKELNIHSLLIIRNGMVVADAYFYPYDGKTVHELASVTKSLMTILIGIAADEKKLRIDQPMLSFFPDYTISNRDALKESITVGHLASMCSGLDSMGLESDEGTLAEMKATEDWIRFALDRKVVWEPGTHFVYDSPGMHILSAILQKATGLTALEFARKNLFEPLGIHNVIWSKDPQGFNHGWSDLYMHPRDAAKIGYLFLHKGVWDGRQIVSREWVEDSVSRQIKTGFDDDYGYGWWVTGKKGQFDAIGRGGQRIRMWPALNIVLVMTGAGVDIDDIEPFIAPALIDLRNPLPADTAGVGKLNDALASILKPPAPKPVAPLPDTALAISGKTFGFAPNPLRLNTLKLEFNESPEARMQITFFDNESPRSGAIGLDGIYRFSPGEYNLPVGQRGHWADEHTFVLEYEEIANRDANNVRMLFEGNRVTIEARERTHEAGVSFEGKMQSHALQ